MERLAGSIAVLWGWRRLLAAFLAGALGALALPPFDIFPVLFLSFPVLVWLLDGIIAGRGRRGAALAAAAATGWAFGFGYFLAGLWWIGAAFLVEADIFGWMMPIAVVALPAGLALFTAAGAALAKAIWSPAPGRIFALALALTMAELARGHLLTGFPWNAFGYALAANVPLMQAASVVGIYGLTAAAVAIFAAPATLGDGGRPARRYALPLIALAALGGLAGFGIWRVNAAGPTELLETRLRVVQPSIPQAQKWLPENRSEIFTRYLELSDSATSPEAMGVADADLLIWPESALPFVFESEPAALPAIAALLPEGTTLVTGMQRVERDESEPQGYRVYNSVMTIDEAGSIRDVYDKVWLVPFGEFLPFQGFMESIGIEQLTRVIGGFAAGTEPRVMQVAGAPSFRPLICYEAIFPGAALDTPTRPGFILNVTNDGWFGDSPGPWQHLRQARLRAVEEGLALVRAANTGVSAVVDPFGRIVQSLGLGVSGVIDGSLPASLEPTQFARRGNLLLAGLLSFFALVAIIWRRE